MRKFVSILCALLPMLYFAGLFLVATFLEDSDESLLLYILVYCVAALAICIAYCCVKENHNLMVKLFAVPVDICVISSFVIRWLEAQNAAADGALESGLGIFLMILLLIPYVLQRALSMFVGAIICGRTAKEHTSVHTLLHLVPVADIVSAAIVYKKLYK